MEENSTWISFLLQQKRELFREIYLFNNDLLSYIDSDYFPVKNVDLEGVCRNLSDENLRREWNFLLKKSNSISGDGEYDFSEKRLLLFLFSAEEIKKIIYCAGSICFAEAIRKVIVRSELLNLKEALGDDIHDFVIKSGALMLSSEGARALRCEGESLIESIFNTGKSIISAALSRSPEALQQRFVLKFPENYKWDFSETEGIEIQFRLIQKIVRSIFAKNHHAAMAEIRR